MEIAAAEQKWNTITDKVNQLADSLISKIKEKRETKGAYHFMPQ